MLQYVQLLRPNTVEEALELYKKHKMALLLAGGCWSRLAPRVWPAVIDLAGLDLRYVREEDDHYAIGAMATQWDVESFGPFQTFAKGYVASMVKPILGTQFRNTATMGGSVASRFGFSDILPTLLALDAQVVLAEAGVMSLNDYLTFSGRDILTEIRIPKVTYPVAVKTMRKSASDFPLLTGAIRCKDGVYEIFVGGRPARAMVAEQASAILTEKGAAGIDEAAAKAAEELAFQANSHASAEYRRAMCSVLVKDMATEVLAWK